MQKISFFIFFICIHYSIAQIIIGADTVISYKFGTSQTLGQNPPYFPFNVLGLPDTTAKPNIPSSDPSQICSIGIDGEIILGFIKNPIIDGYGFDFIVFENVMEMYDGKLFVEPAKISVSKDNINYLDFPFDTLTLKGCAGITPTIGNKILSDPLNSGGDKFDLAIVGIDTVKFIKIKDISNLVLKNKQHPFYHPLISGFDLDAVVAINFVAKNNTSIQNTHTITSTKLNIYPNPTNGQLFIKINTKSNTNIKLEIYNILGDKVLSQNTYLQSGLNHIPLYLYNLTSGIYVIQIVGNNLKQTTKIILNK